MSRKRLFGPKGPMFISILLIAVTGLSAQDIIELKCERRQLYAPIRKQRDAFYLVYGFEAPGDAAGKLRTELKHTEQILRMSYLRAPKAPAPVPPPVAAAPVAPAPVMPPSVPEAAPPSEPETPPIESVPPEAEGQQ